jgi:predicted DNA-binding transcriptional regulator AlpA
VDRIIRKPELCKILGVSEATLWRLEQRGDLPPRRQIGPGSVGWLASEIEEFLATRRPVAAAANDLAP